jgi:hypothetical protein
MKLIFMPFCPASFTSSRLDTNIFLNAIFSMQILIQLMGAVTLKSKQV